MCSRSKKKNFNSVINFRRVTHFRLCLLETHVNATCNFIQKKLIFFPTKLTKDKCNYLLNKLKTNVKNWLAKGGVS